MKQRTPMKRKTPMPRGKPLRQRRREGADVEREEKPRSALPSIQPRQDVRYGGSVSGVAVVKEKALQHSGYMEAVRSLGYCMRCRRSCRPQFCHRDQTKGMGIKTDCREGWPGCAECHWIVGTSGQYPKEERRELELELGRRTREAVKAAGAWPARLPMWSE